MKILVCLKQILDPEIPPREFKIDRQKLEAERGSASLVTNIFCENALESVLQLREQFGGELTALTFGPAAAEEVLRKALALKADRVVRLDNPLEERCGSMATARALAAAIAHLGKYDLIVLGREAGDWGEGQTAAMLAEYLHLPFLGFVDQIVCEGSTLKLRRQTESGNEFWTAQPPLVISITNSETNLPRIPKTRDIMLAHRKPLEQLTVADVGLDPAELLGIARTTSVVDLVVPQKEIQCEFMTGESQQDRVQRFAEHIAQIVRSA